MRDSATSEWSKFRLPKSSYTHGHPNGWYTEWPRIRDVGLEGGHLMSHHGMMFVVPGDFSQSQYGDLTPLATHHKMVVDYVESGDEIVFGANDASIQLGNSILPKANSNLLFVGKEELSTYGGNPSGFGGVWVDENVAAGEASYPFLIRGFADRVIHFEHDGVTDLDLTIEVDETGKGNWKSYRRVTVPGGLRAGYSNLLLPESLDAQWLRVRPASDAKSLTVYLHLGNAPNIESPELFASIPTIDSTQPRSQGILRSLAGSDFELEFTAEIADGSGSVSELGSYHARLNPDTLELELVAVKDSEAEEEAGVRAADSTDRVGCDEASAFIDQGGTRYRLPKGSRHFDTQIVPGVRRNEREVVTERLLMNIHGTIYEVPKEFDGGGVARMRPVTTHNLNIFDFMSWRGMLVMSGNRTDAPEDAHYVKSEDGKVGLWFGNVDDLWKFGAPKGVGGPWKDTSVDAGAASDPYLMAGYKEKVLEISHNSPNEVEFTLEVDFLGTGAWEVYKTLTVKPSRTLTYEFEDGYSTHWVRIRPGASTTCTALFTYETGSPVSFASKLGESGSTGNTEKSIQAGLATGVLKGRQETAR